MLDDLRSHSLEDYNRLASNMNQITFGRGLFHLLSRAGWRQTPAERSLSVASIASPGGFRLWWRQLTGSDAMLDNAHVAEDYLARTTTMYRIIAVGRTCSVP